MTAAPIFIEAMGMASPLGLTAASSYAAMRAGIDRFQRLPYLDDEGAELTGSQMESLGETRAARDRWLPLLGHAIRDMLRGRRGQEDLSVVVALPSSASAEDVAPVLVEHGLPSGRPVLLTGGPLAGHEAIAKARKLLEERRASKVLVAGADSLISARALLGWSRDRRLLTGENPDGMIPGEAAAAVLLTGRAVDPLGSVLGIGFGREPSSISNDIPLRAQGLVEAARAALRESGLEMHDMDLRLSDGAGESYHFKEQALGVLRTLRRNKASFPLWRSAFRLGHTGAAAALCNIVMALSAAQVNRFPGRRAIAYAGDEEGRRSALVLQAEVNP